MMLHKSDKELLQGEVNYCLKTVTADKSKLIGSVTLSSFGILLDLGCIAYTIVTKNLFGLTPIVLGTPIAIMSGIETSDNHQLYKSSMAELNSAKEKLSQLVE